MTGFRSATAAARAELQQLRNRGSLRLPELRTQLRCGPSCAAELLLPPPELWEGQAGWGGRGARRAHAEPSLWGSRYWELRAPCGNTRLRPCFGLCAEPIFRPLGPGAARPEPASAPGGPRCHLLRGFRLWANVPQEQALRGNWSFCAL